MWCGQCFAPLADQTEELETPPSADEPGQPATAEPAIATTLASPTRPVSANKLESPAESHKGTWVCSVCEVVNSLDVEHCSACGSSIFRAFGAEVEEDIRVDPQQALLKSVMFPGLGHAYARQGLLGSAIAGLTLMSLGFGIGLVASGVANFGWPLLLEALGVWAAAAFDAYRLADGQKTNTLLLRPRVITALVGSVMVTVILAATLRGNV
jgi:hypothetical protein